MPEVCFTPNAGGPTYRIAREGGSKRKGPIPPANGQFVGAARASAKLSIATGEIETFGDVSELVTSLLPAERGMHGLAVSFPGRSKGENRNVRVVGFLYTARREPDNDFSLTVGGEPGAKDQIYMLMDVSGLPPDGSPTFARLSTVRNTYERFFGRKNLPGFSYDYYEPPIPIKIEGSLFCNVTHGSARPGPPTLLSHMPTIWRIHPITDIRLGP
jgi:hypothetical protein